MQPRAYILTATLVLGAVVAASFYYTTYVSSYSAVKGGFASTCQHVDGFLTIIADSNGYNDSISHGSPSTPWPVVRVHVGDTVRLLLCNLDGVETHGFAIDHYFDGGIILRPGQAYQLTLTVMQTGSFRIFCDVFCTVHRYMLGSLVVT